MADTLVIDGIAVEITDRSFGAGGQGQAFKGHLVGDPRTPVVVKSLPDSPTARKRAQALARLALPRLSPYLAGPLAAEAIGRRLYHVAPLAEGQDLENDRPRTFPEKLEAAHHFVCQIAILEEHRVAHGDHAPGNLKISDQGATTPFDFDNALLGDKAVPAPDMAGQHMMLAPEIRSGASGVTLESDRFAVAVMLNMILLGRHPAADRANNPAELDKAMSSGRWPERERKPATGETPIAALGADIATLFDAAFAVEPARRPSAEQWRRALHVALQNTWIHACGDAFVGDPTQKTCPHCGRAISIKGDTNSLVILIPTARAKSRTPLKDGETIALGRANLPGMSQAVSSRHLEITRHRDQLLLRHIGHNPTLIELGGKWWRLEETWVELSAVASIPCRIRIADVEICVQT